MMPVTLASIVITVMHLFRSSYMLCHQCDSRIPRVCVAGLLNRWSLHVINVMIHIFNHVVCAILNSCRLKMLRMLPSHSLSDQNASIPRFVILLINM